MWMLPNLDRSLSLCTNHAYMCVCTGTRAQMYTSVCTKAYNEMPTLYCWTVLVLSYYSSLHYSWRKRVSVQYLLISTFFFYFFTSNRITWYLWKDSGFQTACQSPRKFVVSLSYNSPAPFGRGTRMTNGNLRRNPLSFLPLFCLFSCTQTELF